MLGRVDECRWGRKGATARRASSPDDGWRRGRASDPDEVGGDGNIMVDPAPSLLLASVEAQQKESYGGKKKLFPRKSGKYPGRGGKKLDSKTLDN